MRKQGLFIIRLYPRFACHAGKQLTADSQNEPELVHGVSQPSARQRWTPPMVFLLIGLILCSFPSLLQAEPVPDWSIVFFAGTDESEIAGYSDPLVKALLEEPLPENVELLLEQDTCSPDGIVRVKKWGRNIFYSEVLPEHDSADPDSLRRFFSWVQTHVRGRHRLFVVSTHSWGWRGIIQDYTIPSRPRSDTMMPIREFARVMKESGFCPDLIIFDSCTCGNAEFIHQMKSLAPYLVVSQRDTPYSGFPFRSLFAEMGKTRISPRDLARILPERCVREYVQEGSLSKAEGECAVVTFCSIDTRNWDELVRRCSSLVHALRKTSFRERLRRHPEWVERFADKDQTVDLIELLLRLPDFVPDPEVKALCADLLQFIGYPREVIEKGRETISLDPRRYSSFELLLEGDPFAEAASVSEKLKGAWEEANQDFQLPSDLSLAVEDRQTSRPTSRQTRSVFTRTYRIRGTVQGRRGLTFRPWLPGVRRVTLFSTDTQGYSRRQNWTREKDYFNVSSFPSSSVLLSEAHTQGIPFIHGIGLVLHPFMPSDFERSLDIGLGEGASGPRAYRFSQWNRDTGWGDLHLLDSPDQ